MPTVPFHTDTDPKPAPRPEPAPIPETNPAVADWRAVSQRLDAQDAADDQRRRTVVARAGLDIPPERAARAIALSRRIGLRASLLAEPGVLEDAEEQAKGGSFDFESFRAASPAFAAWAEQDPTHAALTADDHRELAKLEALTRETSTMRARPDGGFESVDGDGRITGFWRDPYAFRAAMRDARTAQENADELGTGMREAYGEGLAYQFATGALGSAGSTLGLLGAIDRDTAGIIGGISAAAAEWDSTLVAEVTRGAGGLAADAPLILLGGPLASAARGLGTIARAGKLATRVVGARAAGLAGKAAITAAAVQPLALREGGDAYAGGASLGDAATSWAIETLVPAAFGPTGVERLVTRGLSERAGKALYTSARTLLVDAGLEATEEVTTELAHAIHEVMSGQNPDALALAPLARRLTVAGILGGGAGGAFNLPRFIADSRRKDPATRALAAVEHGNRLELLGAAAQASKTTGRAPDEVERVLNQASQGAEGYLDPEAWTTYWRGLQQDPRAMAQQVLGDARAYDEAARTGGQLRVALGTFAARLPDAARTHFAGEIRSEPDALNRREALASSEALLAEDENDPAAQVQKTAGEQRDAIAAAIEQQLAGAGAAPEVAAEQAKTMARVFAVTAQRAGLTPDQLFARYDLRVNLVLPDILTARDGVPDPVLDTLRRGEPATGDRATAVEELRAFVTRHAIDLTADNATVRKAIDQARQRDQRAALREKWKAEDDLTKPLDKAREVGAEAAAAQQRALAEGPDGQAVLDAALARLQAANTTGGMGLGDLMRALGPDYGFQADSGVKLNARQEARATLFRNALRARGMTLASFADAEGLLRAEESSAVATAGETWSPEQEQAVADAFRLRDLAPAFTAGRMSPEQEAEAVALAEKVGATLDALPLPPEAKADVTAAVMDVRGVVLGQPAYHGTGNPDPYDRFRYDRVGGPGGEGAQAYGWGLYFTGKKEVAAHYKEKLQESEVLVDGRLVADAVNDTPMSEVWFEIESTLREAKGNVAAATKIADDAVKTWTKEIGDKTASWNVDRWTKVREWLKTVQPGSVEIKEGKLYTVEIPDDGDMLNWDKSMAEQSDAVKDALRRLPPAVWEEINSRYEERNDNPLTDDPLADQDFTGKMLYRALVQSEVIGEGDNGPKDASDALRAAGIPGLTYKGEFRKTGGEGAQNYVIFDDSKVAIKTYEQRKDTRRGEIALGRKNAAGVRPMVINLFQRADLSTFFHESGHLYLELLGDLAEDAATPQAIKDDYAKVLSWLGVADRRGIKTEHHEKWARGFEAYLMEGKAPATEIRGAFTRFKLWLTDLYKTVKNLNVELTDEVRGVFDRLLATDEEITDAVELLNARPLFADAAQAGMTAAEFLAYRERADAAIEGARSDLEAQALAEVTRERTAWWKEKRQAVRAEVELEVNRQPDQIAAAVLARGRYPGNVPLEPEKSPAPKLSALAVQAWLDARGYDGEGRRNANRKLLGMSVKGDAGISPDAAAELFGYPSGDALLQALVGRRNREELIDALTDARMQAEHGNLMLDGSMAETARELVNNDRRGELLVTEVKALGKKVGAKAAPSELLRQQAIARVGRMPIKDLRPDLFRAAQARAARRAFDAIARGDHAAALVEKQKELLNYHLTRAAQEAREGVEQDRAFLRKIQTPKRRQDIGRAGGWEWTLYRADGTSETFTSDEAASQAKAAAPGSWYEQTSGYLLQIDGILERYDLSTGSNRGAGQRQSLRAWIEAQREAGAPVNIPADIIDQTQRKSWRELTVDELGAVRDAVAHIAHLAKTKNTLQAAQDKRAFEQARDDAIRTMRANVAKRAPQPRTRSGTDTAFAWLDTATAAHRKVSSLMRQADGDQDGGIWWGLFVRPLNEAADREVTLRREAAEVQKQLWDAWRKAGRDLSERATVAGETLTLNERIAVALQWGNEGNRERLLEGEGWTQAQALAILDTLTEADWTLVRGIWKHIDSYWSDIKAKQERVEGVAPEKVAAVPVVTKFGTFEGGYYPVIYDPKRSAKAGSQEAATAANLYAIGQASRATTRRGHTEARSHGTGKPLLLDVSGISRHLSQVIHDLTHHETIIDLNKLLRDDQISQTVADHLGPAALKQVNDTVAAVAVSDLNDTGIDATLRYIRNGVSIAAMGFNVGTVMMQVTGVGQSMQRVGARAFARGVFRLFSDPRRQESARAFIMGKSAFMRDRGTTQMREINEVLNQVQGSAWRQSLNRLAYMGMQQAQLLVDMPTWYAAYETALDNGRADADAIAMADQAVIDAQGSGLTKDLSGVQRSRVGSMFTVFYSYFSTTYNRTAEALATAGRQRRAGNTGAAAAKLAMDLVQIYTIPALLAVAVREIMDKGDDKEDWLTKLGKEHLSLAMGTMVGLREIAPAAMAGYEYRGPAGATGFAALSKLITQAKQGEVDAALIKAAAQTAGIFGHLPTLQAQRLVEGFLYYLDDRDASAQALIFGPPPRR